MSWVYRRFAVYKSFSGLKYLGTLPCFEINNIYAYDALTKKWIVPHVHFSF